MESQDVLILSTSSTPPSCTSVNISAEQSRHEIILRRDQTGHHETRSSCDRVSFSSGKEHATRGKSDHLLLHNSTKRNYFKPVLQNPFGKVDVLRRCRSFGCVNLVVKVLKIPVCEQVDVGDDTGVITLILDKPADVELVRGMMNSCATIVIRNALVVRHGNKILLQTTKYTSIRKVDMEHWETVMEFLPKINHGIMDAADDHDESHADSSSCNSITTTNKYNYMLGLSCAPNANKIMRHLSQ